jgi:hypothetical protein
MKRRTTERIIPQESVSRFILYFWLLLVCVVFEQHFILAQIESNLIAKIIYLRNIISRILTHINFIYAIVKC